MRYTRLVIPVFLLSAILSGCAAEHEESSSPRTETEPVALNDMQTQTQTDAPNETEALHRLIQKRMLRQKPRQIRRKRMPFPPEPFRKPQKSLRMCPL